MPKILLADDSLFQRKVIKGFFEGLNVEITEAKNGVEVLNLINSINPDCILLDLLMPEKNGIEVLQELKLTGNTIPVIVISADIQESTIKEVYDLGAYAFINKPPKKEELFEKLKEIIKI